MIVNRRSQRRADFVSVAISLINEKAIKENEMHKLKVLTAAVALLFVTPVLAQEMGGATGPGSARGLEPTYNNGYCDSYDQGEESWAAQIGVRSKATTHAP
jgi:hypothetical protein